MAIDIITGFNSSSRESLDKRSGPYATLVDAKAALDTNERYVGLKVLVADGATPDSAGNFIDGDLTEYVFTGGISDNDLVDPIATAISDLIDGAPATLDTLNELSAALEDNANILDNYYTQTQLDHATTGKADKSTTYTETEVNTLLDTKPSSADYDNIVQLTQTAYNALGTPASTTLYIIVG
jgi:hypothetical protein|tara:strand:+ start:1564 stop:2112 length:549 start_codon:yes stop_codon:yes gene_type:complete